MPQVVIRNLDEELLIRLKDRAKLHHRSLEAELRFILGQAVRGSRRECLATADQIKRELAGRWEGDSTALVREDRDR